MKKKLVKTVVLILIALSLTGDALAQTTRIRFARGRTSTTVSGSVAGNDFRQYVLGARRGQYLSANVSSRNGCVLFTQGSTSLGFTTDTGDNYITLNNTCGRTVSYTMTVSITY
ncbi:MAG TPA: hypothetical protein VF721_13910 [Pyrinomonadaceae bacterium]